jgi:hypothetical protein
MWNTWNSVLVRDLNAEHVLYNFEIIPISNHVGGVKWFLSTLSYALIEERHMRRVSDIIVSDIILLIVCFCLFHPALFAVPREFLGNSRIKGKPEVTYGPTLHAAGVPDSLGTAYISSTDCRSAESMRKRGHLR